MTHEFSTKTKDALADVLEDADAGTPERSHANRALQAIQALEQLGEQQE